MSAASIHRWVLISSVTVFAGQLAADDARQAASGPKVELQTVYLTESVGDAHQITIRGELGGGGKLEMDVNTCTLSHFGDTEICTRIALRTFDVKIMRLRLADPTGQGRRLFQLVGEHLPEDLKYFLVVPRRRSESHRLVVDMGDDRRRVVTLEGISPPPKGRPELCRHGEYRAEQSAGQVRLYATGSHPTAGWQTRFEQLPIRIFPPQFRLVCVPPTGPVAQVVTPFEVKTSFKADKPVDQVIVHDARGQHKVSVKQVEKD